jgi:hypothetical protein
VRAFAADAPRARHPLRELALVALTVVDAAEKLGEVRPSTGRVWLLLLRAFVGVRTCGVVLARAALCCANCGVLLLRGMLRV